MLVLGWMGAALADDTDPYLWLEDVEGKDALDWVHRQDHASEKELAHGRSYRAVYDRLLAIMNADDRIPFPSVMGDGWYNFWQDEAHVQGIWRRTDRASYATATPAWQTVLDLDALSAAEGKRWVWHGAQCLPPAYTRCLLTLSDGGSDAAVIREFDLSTGAFVQGGFEVPLAKSSIAWVDQDTVYLGADFGDGSRTDSGYPNQVRRWKRGTPLSSAELVFQGEHTDVSSNGWADLTDGWHREFVSRGRTFYDTDLYAVRDGRLDKVDVPADAVASAWREWLLIELKSDWTVGDQTWATGSLLAARYDDFLAGKRELQALYVPTARTSLAGWSPTRNHLLISLLDNVRSKVKVLTPGSDGAWTESAITGLPEIGDVSIWAVDSDQSDEVFVVTSDFLRPPTLSIGSATPGAPAPVPLKSAPSQFSADGLHMEQFEATSADGTRIPYFQISREGVPLDGSSPTVINGYGGFEISMTPSYSGTIGAAWLEKGGVYILANIRGGGEFGPSWHQAALKENRHKAYEDFAAVAQDLIARKVTSPAHLGAMGGSNGGLLMGNVALRYPELFGAILCQVPLLDMKRYSHLLAGPSWMGEYGDPDDPEQWKFIQTFSPYHLVQADAKYPRILFVTSTRDDRVHPGHARKMAAKMEAQGHDVLFWENTEGGHAGAANNEQRAKMWALSWTFLWNELR